MDPLVVIPGLGSDAAVWSRTIAALEGEVRCLVGDTLQDDSLPAMARRILGDAPATFALAGVSMGGMVALEILRAAPERVTHLALLDTNTRADTAEQSERRAAVNAAMRVADDLRPLATGALGYLVHPDAAEGVRSAIVEMTVRVGAQAYVRQNEAVMARADQRPVLAGIRVPTCVIVGEQDLMTPVVLSREIHAAVRGSTLHILPACGHLPPIERPVATAALLTALLHRDSGLG